MSLPDLTPESVRQAIVEFDRVGRDSFLRVRHYPRCRRSGFCDMSAEVWDQVYRRLADLIGYRRFSLRGNPSDRGSSIRSAHPAAPICNANSNESGPDAMMRSGGCNGYSQQK
jgi:hypothetical protein